MRGSGIINAELLSVGTELLLGDILNTNAQYLSQELAALGINVFFQTTVGDNAARLSEALKSAFERADLVIATGGLGPTGDDLTKETAAEFFGLEMVLHKETLTQIEARFAKMRSAMTENNRKQAYIPAGSKVLRNNNGTAPGIWIQKDGKILILLPGPPFEMKHVFETGAFPMLKKLSGYTFVSKTLHLYGIGESSAETQALDILRGENPTVAIYAKQSGVMFRITARASSEEEALNLIAPVEFELYERFDEYIYGEDGESLQEAVFSILKERKLKISIAESCTGGLLAGVLTEVPGVSEVFAEACVTYSNDAKRKRLGVSEETLSKHGAVSRVCAAEMAEGIKRTSGADIGVSITGIAGPSGGTEGKPVGLVFIGLCHDGKTDVTEFRLSGDRERIRTRAVNSALDIIRRKLQ